MNRCKHCGVPVILMEYPSGERLWNHAKILAVHDVDGLIYNTRDAYFYCSSGRGDTTWDKP